MNEIEIQFPKHEEADLLIDYLAELRQILDDKNQLQIDGNTVDIANESIQKVIKKINAWGWNRWNSQHLLY